MNVITWAETVGFLGLLCAIVLIVFICKKYQKDN